MGNLARFETLRSVGFAAISGTYAAIGTPLTHAANLVRLVNQTDADMIVSTDASNSTGMLALLKGTFVLFDFTTNRTIPVAETLVIGKGTQFYVKQLASPSSGSVYLEAVYSD